MTEQQDQWNVAQWHGKMLVDRNGEKIGKLEDVYVDVPAALHPIAQFSVWAHLRKLATEGQVNACDADSAGSAWRAGAP